MRAVHVAESRSILRAHNAIYLWALGRTPSPYTRTPQITGTGYAELDASTVEQITASAYCASTHRCQFFDGRGARDTLASVSASARQTRSENGCQLAELTPIHQSEICVEFHPARSGPGCWPSSRHFRRASIALPCSGFLAKTLCGEPTKFSG